jgi:NADPH:quinone reductase-like Zn-dependent oxidoreductase
MRGWVLEGGLGVDHLKAEAMPEPEPGPGEVRLRVRASSLNYRDLMMIRGQYHPKMPPRLVPGSDAEGVVDAVGPGVYDWREGARACVAFHPAWVDGAIPHGLHFRTWGGPLDGSLRGSMIVPESALVRPPSHYDAVEAATLPCAAVTAWRALRVDAGVGPGQVVLTQGTGGVSLFAIQLARLAGARVIVLTSSEAKAERARALGADHVISYVERPSWGRDVLEWTEGRGVDAVVELGGASTLEQTLRCVKPGGFVSLIGVLGGGQVPLTLARVFMHGVTVKGVLVGSRRDFEDLVRALEAAPHIRPVVDSTFAFDAVPEAFRRLESGGHVGKIGIDLGGA